MVSERDAQTRGDKEGEKERSLEPADTKVPKIERHSGQTQHQGADQEDAVFPTDMLPRDPREETRHRFNLLVSPTLYHHIRPHHHPTHIAARS